MYSDKLMHFTNKEPVRLSANPLRQEVSQQIQDYLSRGGQILQVGTGQGIKEQAGKMSRAQVVANLRKFDHFMSHERRSRRET
jgi:hypothetical protein